jgi:hypothetical protein
MRLVAQTAFKMDSGRKLREPAFLGLRDDKNPTKWRVLEKTIISLHVGDAPVRKMCSTSSTGSPFEVDPEI